MSWVVEEWKEGLPTKTLQKIQELESQLDKLKKERQQRQFQLESLEAAFQKQKQKAESEKSEISALKRENQSLIESCDNQEKAKQKITHEYQLKESQVNFLEGQLSASKKQIEKLEQELKRYKSDLEKSQLSFNACDMSVCATPQKSFVAPYTPNKYTDFRYEELQEKYQKEVEERKRLETEMKTLRNVPQPPQAAAQSTMTHRDIARHQTSSSVFSWQEDRTPSHPSSTSHDKRLKRSFASSQLLWDQEETPSKRGVRSENLGKSASDSYTTQLNDQLKTQNQELKSRINELEMRLQVQEKDLKNQLNKLQESQALYEKTQRELAERDKTLVKCKEDLARVTAQCEQAANKCVMAEQKLKKVSDELSCQRQNAESARVAAEQKLKEREKENQQEILQQQNSLRNMEQQLSQIKAKMSQEAQQAKNDFNALQSELDRAIHTKKILENETEELRQRLSRAEQDLCQCRSNENDLRKSLEDTKSEKNVMKSQYDQKSKDALKLEEELQTANQTLRQNQLFVDEIKAKNLHLEAELKSAFEKLQDHDSATFLNLKATVHNLEMERNFAQELLKKRENDFEEIKNNLARMMDETNSLKSHLDHKEKECKELINANISLNSWKVEQEKVVGQISRDKDDLLKKIQELEHLLQTHGDQVHLLENDKKNLHTQIRTLQEIVDAKTVDLQNQQLVCGELRQNLDYENQKFNSENEKLQLQISELENAIKEQNCSASLDKSSYCENLLFQEKQLNSEMQKQMKELLLEKEDIQKCLNEAEVLHEQFVTGSRSHMESLQENISSKQNYIESIECAVREKEEQITTLTEKLGVLDANLQSVQEKNKELNDKLQELNLLSESWPLERERLNSQISLNREEIERLTEENKRTHQVNDPHNDQETNKESEHQLETTQPSAEDKVEPRGLPDGAGIENTNELEALQQELVHVKEKHCRLQREYDRLTNANEELTKLLDDLRNNEQSLDNITDLSAYLKEKENSLNNSNFVLETLPMDLDDEKQIHDGCTDSPTLKGTPNTVKSNNDLDLEQELSTLQKQDIFSFDIDQAERATNISDLLVNISDHQIGDRPSSSLDSSQCDDSINLNKDILGLRISGGWATTKPPQSISDNENSGLLTSPNEGTSKRLKETAENILKSPVPPSQRSSPSSMNSNNRGGREANRKSIPCKSAADSILGKSLEDQLWMMAVMASGDAGDFKEFLTTYQTEVDELKKQHLLEMEACKQKMTEQAAELEVKLAAEKQQTEYLSHELEAARLELQCLDLSARSFLSFDTEDLTKTLEVANQSICTVLPIGKLSLSSSELLTNHNLKNLIQSLESTNSETKKDRSILATNCPEIPNEGDENASSLEENSADSTNSNISDSPVSKLSLQEIMETLKMQIHQTTAENLKLLQSLEAGEKKNLNLSAEIESLNKQIEQHSGKDNIGTELQSRVKELDAEKLQLFEKYESISQEKLQLTGRVGDLEKELASISNAMEVLKEQLSQLSGIRESLEIANGNLKEQYLETENEVRRVKSERANMENHALSLEIDLDTIQAKYQQLQEENEEYRRSAATLQDRLSVVVAEKNQIDQELENLTEEKDELEQMCQKLKERVEDLELNKVHNRNLIKILETELRSLKAELQGAKASLEQLSAEKDLRDLQESEKNVHVEAEGLKNQLQQIQGEYQLLLKDSEDMQAQLSKVCSEKDKISKVLECCQYEKRELATNLSSAQEEVAQMRAGIEKLKVRMESDEKKKNHLIGKLKETERNSDHLKDKIENLERELLMSEENLESTILQSESSKEEVEKLKSMKEALEANVNTFRRRIVDLERELEKSKERIEELETRVLTLSNALEKSEMEKSCLNEESGQELLLLRAQLNELQEQKRASAKQSDLEALLEQNKMQLMQQLEEAHNTSRTLELTMEKVTLELRECKLQLDEKTELVLSLEGKLEEAENLEKKLAELAEQKALSDEKCNAAATKNAELLILIDQNKAELLHQVGEAQGETRNMELSLQKIATELGETKRRLEEKEQQIFVLECKLEETIESEKKCHLELLQCEAERDRLNGEIENQQRDLELLQCKVQMESGASESSQAAIRDLKSTCNDLEAQLQSSDAEKQVLVQKVDELTENCTILQSKVHEAEMKIKEKKVLDEQLQAVKQQIEDTNTRLCATTTEKTELTETIAKLRIEQEAQADRSRSDARELQNRLLQAEAKQQAALDALLIQHKEEIQALQGKLTLAEEHAIGHGYEVERLKAANVELNGSLGSAHRQLEELNQLKVSFAELKEEHARVCAALRHQVESCAELEQERDRLKGKINEREEELKHLQAKQQNAEGGASSNEDLLAEIEELKQWLEEKTTEADESVEKYCTIMIKSHKLEEDNDTLKKQLDFLSSKLKQLQTSQEVPSPPQRGDHPGPQSMDQKGGEDNQSAQRVSKQSSKRRREQDVTLDKEEPRSPIPQGLAKRVRKTASRTVPHQRSTEHEEEFQPDGLPDVVQKGFADIPSGKQSPYILRRTTGPVRKSPRLAALKPSPSTHEDLENLAHFSSPAAGGSKAQQSKLSEAVRAGSEVGPMEVSSPLSSYNRLKNPGSDSPISRKMAIERISEKLLHEESETEEACHVQ
ncbi:hypothetical protein XENTR_v10013283 [Xenopus tropicalis]|uniref:Centromere protein F n=1 Tax=Xenopus tropicalis TaxID=8364 RepID=F7A8M3_XENTR|nr:centromere protein F [Xenopus tropicalis]KAE8600501.1 hypothetical protein XENTR_v10013283 [Xenopus tropicalis]|eukprot:XP_002934738.2 PREDICTED: centromere protein F [Xenopus tropicalis]